MYHVSMKATGSYTPEQIVTNEDLAAIVDTSDEWIRTRTGIEERRITRDENTSELAYQAGRRALMEAGVNPESLDLIICATVTPDSFTPATACIIQDRLGAKNAIAYDINAACTGFIYGISIASQFIQNGVYQNALVIGSETLSKLVDWKDRNTCVLFGDGAGAVYLEYSQEKNGVLEITLATDGSKRDLLECYGMPVRNAFNQECRPVRELEDRHSICMQGGEVFKFAVKTIVECVKEVMKRHNLKIDEIDWIIPHQANVRIIESAAKLLKTEMNRFFMNLKSYGNTSSASIGIALDELNRSGKLKAGQKVLLVGFGGGMTCGAILTEW